MRIRHSMKAPFILSKGSIQFGSFLLWWRILGNKHFCDGVMYSWCASMLLVAFKLEGEESALGRSISASLGWRDTDWGLHRYHGTSRAGMNTGIGLEIETVILVPQVCWSAACLMFILLWWSSSGWHVGSGVCTLTRCFHYCDIEVELYNRLECTEHLVALETLSKPANQFSGFVSMLSKDTDILSFLQLVCTKYNWCIFLGDIGGTKERLRLAKDKALTKV